MRRRLARSTLLEDDLSRYIAWQLSQSCVLNVLGLQKNLKFETAFSIVSAYAEHLITLVAVHQWQHVPIFHVSLETL